MNSKAFRKIYWKATAIFFFFFFSIHYLKSIYKFVMIATIFRPDFFFLFEIKIFSIPNATCIGDSKPFFRVRM